MLIGMTGGTGFIGQYSLLEMLARTDWSFVCASRRNNFCGLVSSPRVQYVHSDYTPESLREVFSGIDALIHLGSSVPSNYQPDSDFERVCVEGIASANALFSFCAEAGITNIVFSSSIAVYGDNYVIRGGGVYGILLSMFN